MAEARDIIPNQFFIGCPWKNVRPKYEQVAGDLQKDYPVHCVIVGRTTGQDAQGLWDVIRRQIDESAVCIFDATGSNANVALEFGYAEGIGKRSILARCERKTTKFRAESTIISDLAGRVRAPWKTVKTLKKILLKEIKLCPYVVSFDRFTAKHRYKKKKRWVAVAAIQHVTVHQRVKKPDLILSLEVKFPNYASVNFGDIVDQLGKEKLLLIKRGRHGGVTVPKICS